MKRTQHSKVMTIANRLVKQGYNRANAKEQMLELIDRIDNEQALESLLAFVQMIYNQFKLGRWDAE